MAPVIDRSHSSVWQRHAKFQVIAILRFLEGKRSIVRRLGKGLGNIILCHYLSRKRQRFFCSIGKIEHWLRRSGLWLPEIIENKGMLGAINEVKLVMRG